MRLYIRGREPEAAGFYYRLKSLAVALSDVGLGAYYHDLDPPRPSGKVTTGDEWGVFRYKGYMAEMKKALSEANVFATWMEATPQWREFAGAVRIAHAKDPDPAPIFLWDADDNIEFISPFNPAFANIGTTGPGGIELEEGGAVGAIDSVDGERVEMWKDGQLYKEGIFDIRRNKLTLQNVYENAKAADGVSVASKALADWFRDKVGCANVYVRYNGVRLDDYPKHFYPHTKSNEIRILWQGGDSHFQDLISVKTALVNIARRYPQVKFIVFGTRFGSVWRDIPENQVEHHPWIKVFKAYTAYLSTLGHDINICPLTDEKFNAYKSAIKWYESSVIAKPAATLASEFGPYREIEDGETGLLAWPGQPEEFERKLSRLIEDQDLRLRLGYKAQDWVLRNRRIEDLTRSWVDWVQEVRRRKFAEKLGA